MSRLSAALPTGEANGLSALDHKFVALPHETVVAIVLLDVKQIVTNPDTEESTPTLRIRRVEPIVGTDRDLAAQMMRRAVEERTGQSVLPIEMEDEISALLADVSTDESEDEE